MIRRIPWRKLFVGALCLVPIGCEPHKSWLRPEQDEDDMMAKASSSGGSSKKIIGGDADDDDTSSFWKDTRSPGGLSSEARAIERDLGAF